MGEKGKIPEEAYEDIALMRIQGNTWPTIAKFLKDQYNIEVTNQALSTWYKKNKNTKKTVSIREEYAKEKGDDNVKQELMDLVSNMDRIIEVGLDMLKTIEKTEQDKKIMWHNAYKNITGSIVSASKTKMEMITPDKKDDENNNMDRLF